MTKAGDKLLQAAREALAIARGEAQPARVYIFDSEWKIMSHRWSGWPGAWCLDCGCEDPMETAIALGEFDPYEQVWTPPEAKEKYDFGPCPEPGSRRNDPYANREGDS